MLYRCKSVFSIDECCFTLILSGRYLFIETSWPRLPHETARVESEVIMGTNTGMCLRFWFHMKGAHIGTLNVYLKIIGISNSILWSLSNAQGNNWLQAQVPISSGRRNFQVRHGDLAFQYLIAIFC